MKAILPFLFAATAFAAPKLRLVTTTVGPISIAVGANGPAQSLDAYNAGDGALNLRLTSNQTWVSATAGAQTQCRQRAGLCIPINFAFATSSRYQKVGIRRGVVSRGYGVRAMKRGIVKPT